MSERENIRVEQNQEGKFDRNFDRNTRITQCYMAVQKVRNGLEIASF